jgi:hypothetical protein
MTTALRGAAIRASTRSALLALAACVAACASAPTLKVGWDQHADFSKYKTWAWRPDGSIKDPVWAQRCRSVLADELKKHGLTESPDADRADLWAVVHARLSSETRVASYASDWGYGWGAYGSAWAYDETVQYEVPVGTIVLDLVDSQKKEIVWRGRANGAIESNRTNEEREQKLISSLQQLFAGYPPAAKTAAPAASGGR